jgi:hypothetical protein
MSVYENPQKETTYEAGLRLNLIFEITGIVRPFRVAGITLFGLDRNTLHSSIIIFADRIESKPTKFIKFHYKAN